VPHSAPTPSRLVPRRRAWCALCPHALHRSRAYYPRSAGRTAQQPQNNTVALCSGGKLSIGKKRKCKAAKQADKGEKMRKGVSKGEKELFPLAAGGKLYFSRKAKNILFGYTNYR